MPGHTEMCLERLGWLMRFYQVFISLKINTLMTFRTLFQLRDTIHYCPLPLIINSSINDLRVTDSHFLIIIS